MPRTTPKMFKCTWWWWWGVWCFRWSFRRWDGWDLILIRICLGMSLWGLERVVRSVEGVVVGDDWGVTELSEDRVEWVLIMDWKVVDRGSTLTRTATLCNQPGSVWGTQNNRCLEKGERNKVIVVCLCFGEHSEEGVKCNAAKPVPRESETVSFVFTFTASDQKALISG